MEILIEGEDFNSDDIERFTFERVGTGNAGMLTVKLESKTYGYVIRRNIWDEMKETADETLDSKKVSLKQKYQREIKKSSPQKAVKLGLIKNSTE